MSEIKFQELPPNGRTSADWADIAEQLRQRPGEWALIGRRNTTTAFNIRAGKYRAMPSGEFDAVCRNSRGGEADIYVRYVGGAA